MAKRQSQFPIGGIVFVQHNLRVSEAIMKIIAALVSIFVITSMAAQESAAQELPRTIEFDPDGSGPRNHIHVASFDWKAGNALVDEHNKTPKDMLAPQDDFRMDLYYQTSLAEFRDLNGSIIQDTDLNEDYEITMVAGFGQRGIREITEDAVRIAHTSCKADVNFMEIYYDDTPDANPLEGTGFNDGRLIYEGDVTASGVFLFPRDGAKIASEDGGRLPTVVEMDQHDINQFPGVGTAIGSGRGALESNKKSIDDNFFPSNLNRVLLRSQLRTPFTKVDPAKLFVTRSGGQDPEEIADFGPSIELFAKGMAGIVDMQFEPDAYATFETTAPSNKILLPSK